MNTTALETPENVITLTVQPKPQQKPQAVPTSLRERFKVVEFTNRGGSLSYRVTGIKRDGARVRENYADPEFARRRRTQLETEYLSRPDDPTVAPANMKATRLTDAQLRIAESALALIDTDDELTLAVQFWLKHGRPHPSKDCPRLDAAAEAFIKALETDPRRHFSKRAYKTRVNTFTNSMPNLRLDDIGAEQLEKFLAGRNVSIRTKINDLAAVSAFLEWCKDRPRKWIERNPARDVSISAPEPKEVAVLTLEQCAKLLHEAETYAGGKLLPHFAIGLFLGLRPYELRRLTWDKINLKDCEIRLTPDMVKTKRGRIITFRDGPPEQKEFNRAAKAWLTKCKGMPFCPKGWAWHFDRFRAKMGFRPWVKDILRHTSISHFFRLTGSYGLTAEKFGNSEAIIKKHYQGRVSTEDTKKFYARLPKKGAKK